MANSYIQLLTAVRYLYAMPYRQLEGFTRTLHRLVSALPTGDSTQDVGGEVPELGSGEAESELLQETLHNADSGRNKHS